MVVQHNLSATNSNRQLNIVTGTQAKSTEKLSSGYKINRAADDAAGLAISEKMRRQIRGLTQASNNCQDGVSFCQIADGALNEVDAMLGRLKELAIKAANGSNTDKDREYINSEVKALEVEIDRVHTTSTFNEINIFKEDGEIAPGANAIAYNFDGFTVEFEIVDASGAKISTATDVKGTGAEDATVTANAEMATFVKNAAANAIEKLKSQFPNAFSTAGSEGVKIGLSFSPMDGSGGTLAVAKLQASQGGGTTILSYNLNVDPVDYPPASFGTTTDVQKAELAATIAHEMTHMIMYDLNTSKMLSSSGSFPGWFIEGVAQTSSGDGGWVSGHINKNSSDAEISAYMAGIGENSSGKYGVGYLASLYLGQLVSGDGTTTASEASIKKGLDNILAASSSNKTFDEVLKEQTGNVVTSVKDFENKFKAGALPNQLDFVKAILAQTYGTAGSLLQGFSKTETVAFPPGIAPSAASADYSVEGSASWFSNAYGTAAGIVWPTGLGPGSGGDAAFYIQAGSENSTNQQIGIRQFNVSAMALFGQKSPNVSTVEKALETVDMIRDAGARVSYVRSYYGAIQNRLEHTIKNLDNIVENTTSAESSIRDTDMATEMVRFSNNNILAQAGTSMLAQANQSNQSVLSLLQ